MWTTFVESAVEKIWRLTWKECKQGLWRVLLGPTAIAEHKTKFGRCLTVNGYTIDLDRKLVLISQRNARK
jgi:hypothetical protein